MKMLNKMPLAFRTLRLCQRQNLTHTVTRVYHAASQPLYQKHSWLSHDKVPNIFVTRYRDLHGIRDDETAKEFVYGLNQKDRDSLMMALIKFNEARCGESVCKPTAAQLRLVCLHQTLPFIGFGFLDNFLMIIAGEYIDLTLGAAFGISTMAAAGLGNMISDVAGVGSAYYVESFVAKLGLRTPQLTPSQVDMKSTRWASSLGKMVGVAIGCFIGMFPLLFFDSNQKALEARAGKEDRNNPASS